MSSSFFDLHYLALSNIFDKALIDATFNVGMTSKAGKEVVKKHLRERAVRRNVTEWSDLNLYWALRKRGIVDKLKTNAELTDSEEWALIRTVGRTNGTGLVFLFLQSWYLSHSNVVSKWLNLSGDMGWYPHYLTPASHIVSQHDVYLLGQAWFFLGWPTARELSEKLTFTKKSLERRNRWLPRGDFASIDLEAFFFLIDLIGRRMQETGFEPAEIREWWTSALRWAFGAAGTESKARLIAIKLLDIHDYTKEDVLSYGEHRHYGSQTVVSQALVTGDLSMKFQLTANDLISVDQLMCKVIEDCPLNALQFLVDTVGIGLSQLRNGGRWGHNLLYEACRKANNLPKIKFLVSMGMDLEDNPVDALVAASTGRGGDPLEICQFLINHFNLGALGDKATKRVAEAITWAVKGKKTATARLLFDTFPMKAADFNSFNLDAYKDQKDGIYEEILTVALSKGNLEVAKRLMGIGFTIEHLRQSLKWINAVPMYDYIGSYGYDTSQRFLDAVKWMVEDVGLTADDFIKEKVCYFDRRRFTEQYEDSYVSLKVGKHKRRFISEAAQNGEVLVVQYIIEKFQLDPAVVHEALDNPEYPYHSQVQDYLENFFASST